MKERFFLILMAFTSFASSTVSDRWKTYTKTSKMIDHDTELDNYLKSIISAEGSLEHTGAAPFDEHLYGVKSVLRNWKSDEELADAGLFHSIYGSEGYQGFKLPLKERPSLRKLIGTRAERLVWIFCMVDRKTVDATLYQGIDEIKYEFTARPELGAFPIKLTGEKEWLDFLELSLADWLEQVEGAASKDNIHYNWKIGDAWGYRRSAYKKMSEILTSDRANDRKERLEVAVRMLKEVYSAEGEDTKQLNQLVTPPITEAARLAREAVDSADMFPEDFFQNCEL